MGSANMGSLEVSYGHIGEMQPLLAIWLTDVPREMLLIFDDVLKELVMDEFPNYDKACCILVYALQTIYLLLNAITLSCLSCRLFLKCELEL